MLDWHGLILIGNLCEVNGLLICAVSFETLQIFVQTSCVYFCFTIWVGRLPEETCFKASFSSATNRWGYMWKWGFQMCPHGSTKYVLFWIGHACLDIMDMVACNIYNTYLNCCNCNRLGHRMSHVSEMNKVANKRLSIAKVPEAPKRGKVPYLIQILHL